MLHSGDHVEAHEGIGLRFAHGGLNAFVVVDGVERGNGGIVPSVVENQFAAVGLERLQVGLGGVQNGGEFFVGCGYGVVELGLLVVPIGLLVHHIAEKSVTEGKE